ncbi:Rad4 transglutaminase-like domain-containing protein [Sphaerosporella brunnea]|uniref:Rad4 transglutaminase-like domain-containing protein n=1 Tax=Sphaerosporella brunnea TaxID=1250544 RepID=A0A5J5ESK6_9PEZI|nr:Rad4 transglutaminase-like domain-containing protein [Sphaerosporella brunnea]
MGPKRKQPAPNPRGAPAKRRRRRQHTSPSPQQKRGLMIPGYSDSESLPSTPSEAPAAPAPEDDEKEEEEEEEEEEEDWEDVLPVSHPPATGNLELTLTAAAAAPADPTKKKKGASLAERRTRVVTHCMHVQFLLFHGWVRNRWACDPEVQAVLLSLVPPQILRDVEKAAERKGKGKEHAADPLLKPLGALLHWWRGRFKITAPTLRKRGYKTQAQLLAERQGEGEKLVFARTGGGEGGTAFRMEGETVKGIEGLREASRECRGSRDLGALLFTALCRALGWEARLVYSLQPLGFGFSAAEMAAPPPKKGKGKRKARDTDSESSSLSSLDSASSSEDEEMGQKHPAVDKDLLYPTFWTELLSPITNTFLTLSAFPSPLIGHTPDLTSKFEPRGKKSADAKQVIAYVISYSSDGSARDVTVRYLSKRVFPGKTKGFRIPISEVPVYAYDGSIVSTRVVDWFSKALRPYLKPREKWTEAEQLEDQELSKASASHVAPNEEKKSRDITSVSGYKNHPEYILERHLKRDEAIAPRKSHVKTLTTGKGDKKVEEKVFLREDVVVCKAVENWYREGRTIREGEQPLKLVKRRAVTLARKREIEEKQREGETAMQGLYSLAQTELYIPPPIVDGVIPTNAFGNIDVYVPSMVPQGAIHLPLRGAAKVARKLGVSYAEAVTGFEFRQQRAVPYVDGIVVAAENGDMIRDAWREAEEERKRKEDGKREAEALARWRRFLLKARVLKRLRQEWGEAHPGEEEREEVNPFVRRDLKKSDAEDADDGGGFLQDEDAEGGGFLLDGDDEPPTSGGGGFTLEIEEEEEHEEEDVPASPAAHNHISAPGAISLREMVELSHKTNTPASGSENESRSQYFSPKTPPPPPPLSKKPPAKKIKPLPNGEDGDAPPPPQNRPRRKAARRESRRIVSKYFASAAADEDGEEDE